MEMRENFSEELRSLLEKLDAPSSPEEILALRASPALQERIDTLLEKSKDEGLSTDERREWEQFCYVEHLVRMAKGNAAIELRKARADPSEKK